jgi:phosphate transport system permease protein
MSVVDQGPASSSPLEQDEVESNSPQRKPIKVRDFKPSDVLLLAVTAIAAYSIVWIIFDQLTLFSGEFGFVVAWIVVFLGMYWFVNLQIYGRHMAVDRLLGGIVTIGALCMILPLVLLIVYIFSKGLPLLSLNRFTQTQAGVGPLSPISAGGFLHAIVGTLEQVALAAIMGIPIAVLTAIFLNEIGGRISSSVRIVVTAMSGTPAILAGVFIYSIWVLTVHDYSGFAASFALAILLPTVTRGTEEVLRIVHNDLREASAALGAPDWRTVWSVVLPTARSGLVTSILLGVAVSIGETAPLIMTVFGAQVMNTNPFHNPQAALPLVVYQEIKLPQKSAVALGYTASLVLFILVFTIFVLARILGSTWLQNSLRGRAKGKGARLDGDVEEELFSVALAPAMSFGSGEADEDLGYHYRPDQEDPT